MHRSGIVVQPTFFSRAEIWQPSSHHTRSTLLPIDRLSAGVFCIKVKMDPRNLPKRTTPHFSLYQRECFESGTKAPEHLPPFNTHVSDHSAMEESSKRRDSFAVPFQPDELVKLAKERLSAGGYSYAACDAGLGDTNQQNREAFTRYKVSNLYHT